MEAAVARRRNIKLMQDIGRIRPQPIDRIVFGPV